MYHKSLILIGPEKESKITVDEITTKLLLTDKLIDHPDILTVSKNEKQSVGVGDIQKMLKVIHNRPYQSPNKVAIIDDAEKLTIESQNALLKILEEPPKFTQIILIAKEEYGFLPTITSRCTIQYVQSNNADNKEDSEMPVKPLDFLKADTIDRFQMIDELYKIKPSNERSRVTRLFLLELYNLLSNRVKNKNSEKYKNVLKLINDSHIKLKANSNFKLTLENLAIGIGLKK